jgi:hypothetical protein
VTASSEPCTSAFRMRFSVAVSPDWIWSKMSSSLTPDFTGRRRAGRGSCGGARGPRPTVRAIFSSGAGTELVARLGHRRQAEHLDRRGRTGGLDLLALVVDHRPDPAPGRAGHDRVADLELALVDEDRRDRAAALVEVGLEHDALGTPGRVGLSSSSSATTSSWSSRSSMPRSWMGRHLDDDRVAAPRLGHQLALGELAEHALRIGVVLVDLVDRHDDRHLGRPRVVDRLDRLGHHAVVGGDHEHHDVGRLGAAGAHLRERGVARGVDEGDLVAVALDLVGADVLGDATGLAGDHVGVTGSCRARSSCRGRRDPSR